MSDGNAEIKIALTFSYFLAQWLSHAIVALRNCCPAQLLPCAIVASRNCCPAQLLPRAIVASRNCCPAQLLPCAIVALRNCCPAQLLPCAIVALRNCCLAQLLPRAIVASRNCCPAQLLPRAIVALRNCSLSYYFSTSARMRAAQHRDIVYAFPVDIAQTPEPRHAFSACTGYDTHAPRCGVVALIRVSATISNCVQVAISASP
jgi:hypothetical protein